MAGPSSDIHGDLGRTIASRPQHQFIRDRMKQRASARYGQVAKIFHWVTAILVVAAYRLCH